MAFEYAAFLSYSRRDAAWVEALQQNLEASLHALGYQPAKVFRDETDLGPGRSWVTGLQQGLDRVPRMILIATPESMASAPVGDEWEALVARFPDWRRGRVLVVRAVECPLPPFLKAVEWIDFTNHDEEKYRRGLRDLLGGLLGHEDRRDLPALAPGVTVPDPPARAIPSGLREKVVSWLGERLASRVRRGAIAHVLGPSAPPVDGHPSWECAASALIVGYTGGDEPVQGLQRLLDAVASALEEDLPEEVAALGPIRSELERLLKSQGPVGLERLWLERVVRDHGRLEVYFQNEADLDLLAQVYVELDLAAEPAGRPAPGAGSEPDGEAAKAVLRQSWEIGELLALEPGAAAGITGWWVVLGDPGAGKTTLLLRHLAASLAREALAAAETPRFVPVYESLPVWLREREALPRRLERRLRQTDAAAHAVADSVEEWGRRGRLLLLLDGLDEVPRERRDEAEEWIRDLVLHWPDTRIVIASRPIGYRPPGSGFQEVRLLPLDRQRRRELLARWLGRRRRQVDWTAADRALAVLDGDRSLWDLSGNPLYLTLMAKLIEEGGTPDRNRALLYKQIFAFLLAGKHRPRPVPMDAQEATQGVLRHLAFGMTEDNRDAEPRPRLEARFLGPDLDRLREPLYRIPRWHSAPGRFFDDLAERTGILGPYDGEEADWRYWHRTFREALTAERLEEILAGEGGREAVLTRAGGITAEEDASRWAEPYALLAGHVDEPDRLVRELVAANRPLGLRALASARTLTTETVMDVLGLTGDHAERAEVYREMPRLIADGRVVLDLVERLRRDTRSGDDLFWLHWVAREVGQREPERTGEAEAVLGRFFDHVPAPPVEAFREVETVRDGPVPLWCNVPAGEFWMGSPEDEEGRVEDEGPRHRVRFRSSFRLAAVPVTQRQYALFDPQHRSFGSRAAPEDELPHHPVTDVTWWAAVSFCRWVSQALPELAGARLPTDAEWEYACRAGSKRAYWNGDGETALRTIGWYLRNSEGRTHRVGECPANPWGLYDVHGNVLEWTLTPWSSEYLQNAAGGVTEDPKSVTLENAACDDPGQTPYAARGGSCMHGARIARSAYREWIGPWNVWQVQGFRIVRPAAPRYKTIDPGLSGGTLGEVLL